MGNDQSVVNAGDAGGNVGVAGFYQADLDSWRNLGLIDFPTPGRYEDNDSDVSQVIQGLYVGGRAAETDVVALSDFAITHVLSLKGSNRSTASNPLTKLRLKWLVIDAVESPVYDLAQHFSETNQFIEEGRAAGGVLVLSETGNSRAPVVAIAYLMARTGLSVRAAWNVMLHARPTSRPNSGFVQQLHAYEQTLGVAGVFHPSGPAGAVHERSPLNDFQQDSTTGMTGSVWTETAYYRIGHEVLPESKHPQLFQTETTRKDVICSATKQIDFWDEMAYFSRSVPPDLRSEKRPSAGNIAMPK